MVSYGVVWFILGVGFLVIGDDIGEGCNLLVEIGNFCLFFE